MAAERRIDLWKGIASTLWRVFRRTWRRFNGRDVMLFAGGVSFFGLLAIFPGVAVAVSIFGLVGRPEQVTAVVFEAAELMPPQAGQFFLEQMRNLTSAPPTNLSLHGLVAGLIAFYGAVRGVKALLAGLNRISTSVDVRGILSFNLLAAALTLAATFAAFLASVIIISLPVILRSLPVELRPHPLLTNIWLWSAISMFGAVTLLYRFAMAQGRVRWTASVIGAASATVLWTLAAGLFALYVSRVADFRATYGSIGAVVVFLMWIYVAAYSVFFGAALATEAEIELEERTARALADNDSGEPADEGQAQPRRKRVWTRRGFLR
jgi:membrane protein